MKRSNRNLPENSFEEKFPGELGSKHRKFFPWLKVNVYIFDLLKCSSKARLVLLTLVRIANYKLVCKCRRSYIAERCGLSESSVKRALKELRNLELIKVSIAKRESDTKKNQSNTYSIAPLLKKAGELELKKKTQTEQDYIEETRPGSFRPYPGSQRPHPGSYRPYPGSYRAREV